MREACEQDLPQLVQLEASCNPHPWNAKQLQSSLQQDTVWVIEEQSQIVAMLVSKSILQEAEIYLVNTAPAFRRQGLAKRLIEQSQQIGRAHV